MTRKSLGTLQSKCLGLRLRLGLKLALSAKDSYPWLMSRCYGGNFPFIEMQDLARSVSPNSSLDYLCAVRLGLSLDKSLQCDTACFVFKTASCDLSCSV